MNWENIWKDEQIDENYNEEANFRDGTIFLIDCENEMFDENWFSLTIKTIRDWMLRDIIANDKNQNAVILFNTKITKNMNEFKHIYVYQDFQSIGADVIKKLEYLILNHTSFERGQENCTLAECFWLCSNMFISNKYKIGSKKVFLFTANPNPVDNIKSKKLLMQRVKDLYEQNIDIEIVGYSNKIFDLKLFYQDVLGLSDEEVNGYPNYKDILRELTSRLRIYDYHKKAISKLPLIIGPNLAIGISLYSLVSSSKMPTPIKLDKDTLEIISQKGDELILPEENMEDIEMAEPTRKYMEYGGAKIIFEPEEIKKLKDFGSPYIKIMGFKPVSFIKPYWFVRPTQFIFPEEKKIIGSTKLFRALLTRCHERQKVIICSFVPRRFSQPYLVALMPQMEIVNPEGVQLEPSGFYVKYLPYAEDFRKISYPMNLDIKSDPETIDLAKQIIQKSKFTYAITNFENPVLQRHYRVLEALALDRPSITGGEEFHDSTLPNYKVLDERLHQPIKLLKNKLNISGTSTTFVPSKKIKLPNYNINEIMTYYKNDTFDTCTLPMLKKFCTTLNIQKSSGNKPSYIKTLKAYFKNNR